MRVLVLALLVATLAAAGVARELPRPVLLEDPRELADPSFSELVPSVRLPTSEDGAQRIEVRMSLPEGALITAIPSKERSAPTLVFPPGTLVRRVEKIATPEGWAVLDVRGISLEEGSAQRFHVLLPATGEVDASLLGLEWRRGGGVDEQAAERIVGLARAAPLPVHGPRDEDALARLRERNACTRCHRYDEARAGPTGRPTDASGFFSALSVLLDESPVPDHRPRDLNAQDPFVAVRCDEEGPAALVVEGRRRSWSCPDGERPLARRDVRAGLAAGDPYTRRVCASRRFLYERMDAIARHAFGPAFEACGIGRS